MTNKTSFGTRLFVSNPGPRNTALNWNGSPKDEFYPYAGAFRNAAATLVKTLDLDRMARSDFDACPVVFLYRHALELMMKAIITGDGGKFLRSEPKAKSIYKTHSLSELLAVVFEIIEAVGPSENFVGDDTPNVTDIRSFVEELDAIDPGSYSFRYPVKPDGSGSVERQMTFSVVSFAERIDTVLECILTRLPLRFR